MKRHTGRATAVVLSLLTMSTAGAAQAQGAKTLGPAGCGVGNTNCHTKENSWWTTDKHSRSSKPFENLDKDYVGLAARYGIDLNDDAAVNQKCMNCHGTVVTGREKKLVGDGVSCESCHGPGSGYLDAHQDPDYARGLAAGLRDLRTGPPRSRACVSCHLTVDPKLVRAGHPPGWSSPGKFVREMKSVAGHWGTRTKGRVYGSQPVDADEAPFAAAIQAKGPLVAPDRIVQVQNNGVANGGEDGGERQQQTWVNAMPSTIARVPAPAEVLQVIVLANFPVPSDSASVGDILSVVKLRLDGAYTAIQSAYGRFR